MNFDFLKNKEVKNASWIIGEQVFQMMIQLVLSIITARYLGPSNYGMLNYTASCVSFFSSIALLGAGGVIVKKIIDFPDREGEYLGSIMIFRIFAALFSMVSVSFIVFVLNPDEPIKLLLVVLQSIQLVFKAVEILDSWFQRHLKSKYVSIGKMLACIAVSAYKIFLLVSYKSIAWFAFSNSLSDLVIAFVMFAFYRHNRGQRLTVKFSTGKEVLSESYHFILSGIMVSLYSQTGKMIIGEMMTDADVGLYTAAAAICGLWLFVPNAIINSFRPKIMALKSCGDEKQYKRRLSQLYSGIIWLCISVSIVVCIFAKLAIWILYGEAYLGAVSSLRIVIWSELFSMIGTMRGIWILCENKNKYVKYYLAMGTVVNIVLNFILIPILGIEGAAVSTLLTQVSTSIIAPLAFKGTREHTKIVINAFACTWYFRKDRE